MGVSEAKGVLRGSRVGAQSTHPKACVEAGRTQRSTNEGWQSF